MQTATWYSGFAKTASHFCGRPRTFALAVAIITFLMFFLIQNTQNRDTEAIQIKLDELIRATKGAHNALLDLEELEEETLHAFRRKYQALASNARANLERGSADTGTPEA